MRVRLILIAVVLLVIAGAAAWFFLLRPENGSGSVAQETRPVSGFDSIRLNGSGTLVIQQGDRESLQVSAETNLLKHITTTVNGTALVIDYHGQYFRPLHPTKPIQFYITVRNLSSVALDGAGVIQAAKINTPKLSISVKGAANVSLPSLNTDELDTNLDGASTLTTTGAAGRQNVKISGAGAYDGLQLTGRSANVAIDGAGRASVNVSDTLDVHISGAGMVEYAGKPTISQDAGTFGRVVPAGSTPSAPTGTPAPVPRASATP